MSSDIANLIQSIIGLFSVIISIVAIIIASRVEIRAEKRFKSEIELQKKIAKANLRPILTTIKSDKSYMDGKYITLKNAGVGTAVIKSISFSRGQKAVRNLSLLFNLSYTIDWEYFWSFGRQNYYIEANTKIYLIGTSAENLRKQGFSRQKITKILNEIEEQMSGITIEIAYEDVLGNQQEDYRRTIKAYKPIEENS